MTESSNPAPPLSIAELDVVSQLGLDRPEPNAVDDLIRRGINRVDWWQTHLLCAGVVPCAPLRDLPAVQS